MYSSSNQDTVDRTALPVRILGIGTGTTFRRKDPIIEITVFDKNNIKFSYSTVDLKIHRQQSSIHRRIGVYDRVFRAFGATWCNISDDDNKSH